MSTDLANLVLGVDSTQVDKGAKSLDNLAASGDKASASTKRMKSATDETSKSANDYSKEVENLRIKMDPLYGVHVKLTDQLNKNKELYKAGAIGVQEFARANDFAHSEAEKAAAAIEHVGHASSGATREMLVLARETARGDFTRMAGSASILAGQLGVMQKILSPVGLGIGAIAIALGAAAAAAIVYTEHMKEVEQITAGVGRNAGVTAEALVAAANRAAAAANISVGTAQAEALEYTKTGKIGTDVFEGLIEITDRWAKATGQSASEARSQLAAAFSDPAKGARDLNDKLNFLNETQLKRIEQLAAENDRVGAQKAILDALRPSLVQASQDTASLAYQWNQVKIWADNAAVAIGKALSGYDALAPTERLKALKKEQQDLTSGGFGSNSAFSGGFLGWLTGGTEASERLKDVNKQIADTTREIANLKKQTQDSQANTKSAAGGAVVKSLFPDNDTLNTLKAQQTTLFAAIHSGAHDSAETVNELQHAYKAVSDTISRVTDVHGKYITQQQREHEIALLTAKEASTKDAAAKGQIASQIALLKAGTNVLTNEEALTKAKDQGAIATARAAASGDRHAQELAREAQSMTVAAQASYALADAYLQGDAAALKAEAARKALTDATKKGIDAEAQIARQLALDVAQQAANSAKSIANLRAETAAKKAANDNIEAGAVPEAVALQQMRDELQLRPLLAAASVAQGKELERLTDLIKKYREAQAEAHKEDTRASEDSVFEKENAEIRLQTNLLGKLGDEREAEAKVARLEYEYYSKTGQRLDATKLKNLKEELILLAEKQRYDKIKNKAKEDGTNEADDVATQFVGSRKDSRIEKQKAFYKQIEELQKNHVLTAKEAANSIRKFDQEALDARLKSASDFFGNLASLSDSKSKTLRAIGKAAAIAQATIDTYRAVNAALAAPPGPPATIPFAIAAGVFGAANVAKIAGLKDGGYVSGPGGPKDDKAGLFALSNGEFVVNAQGTAANRWMLEMMNEGKSFRPTKKAEGGYVSSSATPVAANNNSLPTSRDGLKIEFHNHGTGKTFDVEHLSEDRIRIIARDEARTAVTKEAGKVISGHIRNPNSPVSKALKESTTASRRHA
jgi:hypothetical protein